MEEVWGLTGLALFYTVLALWLTPWRPWPTKGRGR